MGESILETPKVEYKMGETVTSVPTFQQSVSFGRFEDDTLCWEKWSTFPTNRYLDEVEKCSTPGSVAQKKAYFEAHYKSIAARRTEILMDQERQSGTDALNADKPSEEESDNGNSEIDQWKNDAHKNQNDVDVIPTVDLVNLTNETCDGVDDVKDVDSIVHIDEISEVREIEVTNEGIDYFEDGDVVDVTDTDSIIHVDKVSEMGGIGEVGSVEVANDISRSNDVVVVDEVVKKEVIHDIHHIDDSNDESDTKETDKQPHEEIPESGGQLKKSVSATEDVTPKGDELPQEKVKRTITEEKSRNPLKLATPKKMLKPTLVKKTASTTNAMTKPASPIPKRTTTAPFPKSPMFSTPKSRKPDLRTKLTKSANNLLGKKEDGFTLPTTKKSVGLHSKRVAPTSLHMSLSLEPNKSNEASVARKPLIMEKMGDKDIVKRAFKSFQNPPQALPSPSTNRSLSRKVEPNDSSAKTLVKKNDGIGRTTTAASSRSEQGTRNMASSIGVKKNDGTDQRNSVAVSSGQRAHLQGTTIQKEVSKKLELKPRSNVCEATHTHLQSKLKVDKASQVKNPSQGIGSQPKLLPSYSRRVEGSVHKDTSMGTSKRQVSG